MFQFSVFFVLKRTYLRLRWSRNKLYTHLIRGEMNKTKCNKRETRRHKMRIDRPPHLVRSLNFWLHTPVQVIDSNFMDVFISPPFYRRPEILRWKYSSKIIRRIIGFAEFLISMNANDVKCNATWEILSAHLFSCAPHIAARWIVAFGRWFSCARLFIYVHSRILYTQTHTHECECVFLFPSTWESYLALDCVLDEQADSCNGESTYFMLFPPQFWYSQWFFRKRELEL